MCCFQEEAFKHEREHSLHSPFHDNQEGHMFRYRATQPGSLSHCWERSHFGELLGSQWTLHQ